MLGHDGSPWIIDFGFSELAASDDLLATDVAELIMSTALIGRARAGGAGRGRRAWAARRSRAPRRASSRWR